MQCPKCKLGHINKNGPKKGKQNFFSVYCGWHFIECYEYGRGYSQALKQECLKMYVNFMWFRGIERVKKMHQTTIINLVKQVGKLLPDCYALEETPAIGELDELDTFVSSKKSKFGYGKQ